jgi:hypothetical protein
LASDIGLMALPMLLTIATLRQMILGVGDGGLAAGVTVVLLGACSFWRRSPCLW